MKKIYAITLDGEEYLSGRFRDNIRLISAVVYEQIYHYNDEYSIPLNINRCIVHNDLCYARTFGSGCYNDSHYRLSSDEYDDGYINYEPFIVGNRTFGLTIVDDSLDMAIVESIVKYALNLLRLNYKFKIEVFPYESKNIDDESHRDVAINQIYSKYSYEYVRRNKLVRMLRNGFSRHGKNVGVYGR